MRERSLGFSFGGFAVAGGVGMAALPVCVFLDIPPHVWGSLSIGALPLGALSGLLIAWATEPDGQDDDEPSIPRKRSTQPPIVYDPSKWTGRPWTSRSQ